MKKMLVVYYSWSNGNTKRIAEQLTNGTGADIARIETTEPYSGSHEDVVEQGKREVEAGFMPQINPISVNLADYDVIAIGTPTWWYTMAPAVLTFLPTNDFTPLYNFFIKNIVQDFLMYNEFDPKHYKGK